MGKEQTVKRWRLKTLAVGVKKRAKKTRRTEVVREKEMWKFGSGKSGK